MTKNWSAATTLAIAATLAACSSVRLYQLVREHGWNGALLYIWEGDPHPRHIRGHVHVLDKAESLLHSATATLGVLQEALQRARLNSVDDSDPSSVVILWKQYLPTREKDLRQTLARISHDLDAAAATIDQIPTQDEIRIRKKSLSTNVVQCMEQVDTLIAFFKRATDTSK